ncbi:alpha/beta hydrolase [Microbaculum marinum]|uniref:Alpha/beta hydrolase n=1 Tax=Microbaculum marinum TaxID=1764581 RepID=A0AAW9RVN1_9HYPH
MTVLRLVSVFILALVVAGCAGRPTGVLIPFSGEVSGTNVVDILVATTRGPDEVAPGMMFSGSRAPGMAYADIAVSIPPDDARSVGEVQWPRRLPGDPATEFVTVAAERVDEDTAIDRFQERVKGSTGRHVLVFVHGYNNRFEDAVYRFAQIVHDSDASVVPVLFTWPSRGEFLAYTYDRESTNFSRDALERLLTWLARDKSVSNISVLAHSMGNWLTLESLRQMAIRNGHIATKIQDVMLAAPDVDVDVFQTQVASFGEPRPRFTLFVSRNDKALAFSRRVWGSTARLGAIDPNAEPYRSELANEGITVVDLTDVHSADKLNHGTFAQSPAAVQLIGRQLAGGQEIATFNVGLGDRVGQIATATGANIGAAAGLVVTAPIAIIDPNTRNNFDGRVAEFGSSVEDTFRASGELVTMGGTTTTPRAEPPEEEPARK